MHKIHFEVRSSLALNTSLWNIEIIFGMIIDNKVDGVRIRFVINHKSLFSGVKIYTQLQVILVEVECSCLQPTFLSKIEIKTIIRHVNAHETYT